MAWDYRLDGWSSRGEGGVVSKKFSCKREKLREGFRVSSFRTTLSQKNIRYETMLRLGQCFRRYRDEIYRAFFLEEERKR